MPEHEKGKQAEIPMAKWPGGTLDRYVAPRVPRPRHGLWGGASQADPVRLCGVLQSSSHAYLALHKDVPIERAIQRPTMKFVATKTAEQLDLQPLHRVRERLLSQRTGTINQILASWSAASRFGKGNGSCAQSCRASWPHHPMCCRRIWYRSLKD